MKKKPSTRGYEDMLIESVADEIMQSGDSAAADHGPPPDTSAPSERRKVQLWGQSDPNVDVPTLTEQLQTTGVPPDQLKMLQIATVRPDLAPLYGQPIPDPQVAEVLAKLAEYPFRVTIFDHPGLGPKERVAEAERLDRAWRKTQPGADDMATEPTQQPSPMPMTMMGG